MTGIATAEAGSRTTQATIRVRFISLLERLGADRSGSTAIEYGLTLAGIALSASGVSAAIGFDIAAIFDQLQLDLCTQVYSVCTGR